VFDEVAGFSFVQLQRDHYVGYIESTALSVVVTPSTHRVAVPSTLRYPRADLKSAPAVALPMNAALSVGDAHGDYLALSTGGFVWAAHVSTLPSPEDYVSIAARFLNVPYLWGGKTFAGLDCSGLVQTALHATGRQAPRDSDMQEKDLGVARDPNDLSKLQRGDLIFWKGHVGIMESPTILLHANGSHMMVARELLSEACTRITAKGGGPITAIRRV
jgi:cell wall-associated NlpC family hydrolase